MHQNPSLNPNSMTDPYAQNLYLTQNCYYPQNPNPTPSIVPQGLHESHYNTTLVHPQQPGVTYTQPHDYSYQQIAYYENPTGLVATQATVTQYGVNPYVPGVVTAPTGIENLVPAVSTSSLFTYPTVHPIKTGKWKKLPKKTKVVQSAWCEICKIECNTKDILDQHKFGKKHKKNLEKLTGPAANVPAAAAAIVSSAASHVPVIGPIENPNKTTITSGQKVRKKVGKPPEDLEAKRRKVLEGGAAANAVRTCPVCNVVCNSETVFRYHLAGQKHAAMMKKQSSLTRVAAAM